MDPVTVLGGHGFVGGTFWDEYNLDNWVRNDRNDHVPKTKNVVCFTSTVHNYNIFTDPYLDIEVNCTLLMKYLTNWHSLVGGCRETSTFNFISSWFVYGGDQERHDVKETDYCDPRGFYSITKRTAEQLLISYCKTFGLNYRILRLGNVIGPGDKKASQQKNALQWMVNTMKTGAPIVMYGDGNYYRDYIHVIDAASAINSILHKGDLNTIYNVGNGPTKWKFRDILYYTRRKVEEQHNVTVSILGGASSEFHQKVQVRSFSMNVDKLKALGYQPRFTDESLYDSLL